MNDYPNNLHIAFILECRRNGEKWMRAKAKFLAQWPDVSLSTFNRRWSDSAPVFEEERKTIHAMVNQEIAQEVELQKGSIMTAVERQIVLSQMARGDMKVAKTVVVNDKTETVEHLPDFKERKNAIAELNKMEGIYQRELTVFEQQTTVIRPKPKNADL